MSQRFVYFSRNPLFYVANPSDEEIEHLRQQAELGDREAFEALYELELLCKYCMGVYCTGECIADRCPMCGEVDCDQIHEPPCPVCNVEGCTDCENTCPDCGSLYCMGECQFPRPYQVGSAFGGPVAIMVHQDAEICGCYGGGWHITDYDSIHRCPMHRPTRHHPECANEAAALDAGEEPPSVEECCG
jgi:hypothetical protein